MNIKRNDKPPLVLREKTFAEYSETPDEETEVPVSRAERLFKILHPLSRIVFVGVCLLVALFLVVFGQRDLTENDGAKMVEKERVEDVVHPTRNRNGYSAAQLQRESALRDALMNERGGRVNLTALNSLRRVGQFATDDLEGSIEILNMAPNLVRVGREDESGQIGIGFDGIGFWKFERGPNGVRSRMALDQIDQLVLDVFDSVHSPLISILLNQEGRIVSVEDVDGTSEDYIRIIFLRREGGKEELVDLSQQDLRILRHEFESEGGEELEVVYGDHADILGVQHPREIEVRQDGDRLFLLSSLEIVPNFGAVRLLFRSPVES
ncbi:MAG: hypothetical protein AAGJ81_05665 [Verrucomicrobiota bacterium]